MSISLFEEVVPDKKGYYSFNLCNKQYFVFFYIQQFAVLLRTD